MKLDENGNKEWSNPLGDDFLGRAYSIQQTADGGYIVAGDSVDFKSEFDYTHYLMAMKLDEGGNIEWNYFGDEYTDAQFIQQTEDDGYILAGNTKDDGHGLDFLIIKLDENGNENWIKKYGTSGGWEYASAIQQTSDGGYSVAGQTDSNGAGRYDIWILKLDENGNGPGPVGIYNSNNNQFKGFSLSQNYPNPFNPSTTIRFNLPKSSFVTLTVYDILGKEIETIVHGQYPAGEFRAEWTAKDLSSGIYFYRLQAGRFVQTKKFILQK
ncbi:T9SS type A sorting domain-containing protein [bacterium]|nr:T9SS type A sorting domain-containing protein [bacterium]